MPSRETRQQRARRNAREVGIRLGLELRRQRTTAGLSQRELGRRTRMSHGTIGRIERGELRDLSLVRLYELADAVGLEPSIRLYPSASPVRDRAHLGLLERLRKRLHPDLRMRLEVPMPTLGDLRSVDGRIDGDDVDVMIEAETRLEDGQAVVRRVRAKQRDLGRTTAILLLADTRHNRAVLAMHPELVAEFPVSARSCLAALAAGRQPPGDAIVLL